MTKSILVVLVPLIIFVHLTRSAAARSDSKESIPDLFKRVSPSVVLVSAIAIDPFKLTGKFGFSAGSGFIISPDGLVLTNSHVVFGSKSIMVKLGTYRRIQAVLLGADPILDVAVLWIPVPSEGLPVATLGDSDALRVGEEVLAIGNPLGFARQEW